MAMRSENPVAMRTRIDWREIAATVVVCALVFALVVVVVQLATPMPDPRPGALYPCATEDSTGCYWDADTMGNGLGQDYVSTEPEQ